MSSYIRKCLKFKALENADVHFLSESLIKIMLRHNVMSSIKTQLMVSLENVLGLDSERGAHGL